jgi:hypothetical protein
LIEHYRGVKGLPANWKIKLTDAEQQEMISSLSGTNIKAHFQQLLDQTWIPKYTRDRMKVQGDSRIPQRLICMDVQRVENEANYLEYMQRRTEIKREISKLSGALKQLNNVRNDFPTSMGVRTQMNWAGIDGMTQEPVDHSINEFYLLHGTNPGAATAIAKTDFRVDLAGGNAGTLYGLGIYFCESSCKADEFTFEDSRGWRPILLCRVLMANINYVEEPFPNPAQVQKSVTHGEWHSVLGDREKCRGTFREYIVYDNAQVYPEWIIWYQRQM